MILTICTTFQGFQWASHMFFIWMTIAFPLMLLSRCLYMVFVPNMVKLPCWTPPLMMTRTKCLNKCRHHLGGLNGYNWDQVYQTKEYIGNVTILLFRAIRARGALVGDIQILEIFLSNLLFYYHSSSCANYCTHLLLNAALFIGI